MPIMQWLYFDALECLAEAGEEVLLTEEECAPVSMKNNLSYSWVLLFKFVCVCVLTFLPACL